MLSTSSIPMTATLEKSIDNLQTFTQQPGMRLDCRQGTGQVSCQRVIEKCVHQILISLEKAKARRNTPRETHVDAARASCKLLRLVIRSIAQRPQYAHSLAARSGLQYLEGQVDRAEQCVDQDENLGALVPLTALLVNEFGIKDVSIPKAWFDEVANSTKPDEKTGHVPVLAMAS